MQSLHFKLGGTEMGLCCYHLPPPPPAPFLTVEKVGRMGRCQTLKSLVAWKRKSFLSKLCIYILRLG